MAYWLGIAVTRFISGSVKLLYAVPA